MLITKVRITNYKSFQDTEDFGLMPGFNVIVGENNSGKTALLEALSLQFQDIPHRSTRTIPYPYARTGNNSRVNMTLGIEQEELVNILLDNHPKFHIPVTSPLSDDMQRKKFLEWFLGSRLFNYSFIGGGNVISAVLEGYEEVHGVSQTFIFEITRDNLQPQSHGSNPKTEPTNLLAFELANILKSRVYAFRAERFHVGQSSFGTNALLSPDASNLPEVLNHLQGFRTRFDQYNALIRQVFPQIKEVSIRPISEKEVKIFVLNQSNSNREDLAVPLQDSGTGIGQVLAILYVVLTADFPRTIIIDEPQSFLHPGAIRRLFSILKQYPEHQYIVTTHSPIVINAADPQSLLLVRKQNEESTIEVIDRSQKQALETVLAEVGARLSDVFGADNILWVEGDTEELCFPLILSQICKQPLLGTVILGVIHTGDIDGKQSEIIFKIYQKLSRSTGLLPPAIGFIFDQEGRTQTDQDDLIRQSRADQGKQTVFFTSRRMFENYLLNPEAIAGVMLELEGFKNERITSNDVQQWINNNKWEKDLFIPKVRVPREEERTDELWLEKVHGAKVLQNLFKHFSKKTYEYDKKDHGLALTQWIIENSPDDLRGIADLILEALGRTENK